MESTAVALVPTITCADHARSLADAFDAVPDPRRQASIHYPLSAVLRLTLSAILCGRTSLLAVAEWGAHQPPEVLMALGFPAMRTPCQSTLQRLLCRLDPSALSVACQQYFANSPPRPRGTEGIAIDGKAQRGRLHYDPAGTAVHALVAFCHERGVVLAQDQVVPGIDKAEAELTVAPILIDRLQWRGRVLTGDALHCQRHLCEQVLAAGGDYLLVIKANQRRLLGDVTHCFTPPLDLVDCRRAATLEQGHGRTAEHRTLLATTDLVDYLDWPGHAQVFQLTRVWKEKGTLHTQIRYGITSLPPENGTAERLLALKRGHWSIENRGHRTKDVALGEDASLIHMGAGPAILAMLRDAAVSLLHDAGISHIAAHLRRYAQCPHEAVALVLARPTRA